MENQPLARLFTLIKDHRDELLVRWRQQVRQLPGAANLDVPTINDQVPELLNNLAEALKLGNENSETNAISAEDGLLRWQSGFDVTEIVAEYNILRQCVQDAAEGDGIVLAGKALHIINSAISVIHRNITRLSGRVRQVLFNASGFGRSFTPEFALLNLRSEVENVARIRGN